MKKLFFISISFLLFGGCKNALFMGIEQQKKLGMQVRDEILANPKEYPVLSEKAYPEAYGHIRRITNGILNSGKVKHKDDFEWEVRIIQDDKTLNAFCTPGGYIFVYTGLIKYLDSEDQLAGVMGHEIAHADREHSARAMEKQMGVAVLVEVLAGQNSSAQIKQMVTGVIGLRFSRGHETEADMYSVEYLSGTSYRCNGAADFFVKIGDQPQPPVFLSTHPNPGNRVEDINKKALSIGCTTTKDDQTEQYKRFKASLP